MSPRVLDQVKGQEFRKFLKSARILKSNAPEKHERQANLKSFF